MLPPALKKQSPAPTPAPVDATDGGRGELSEDHDKEEPSSKMQNPPESGERGEMPPFMEHPFMENEPDPEGTNKNATRSSGRQVQAPVRLGFTAKTNPTSVKSLLKRLLVGVALVETIDSFRPSTPKTATMAPNDINPNPTQFSHVSMLSESESEKLKELQALDRMNEALHDDDDDTLWRCIRVLDHRSRKIDPDDHHVKVRVLFNNGDVTWSRMDAVRVDDPIPLCQYAVKARLLSVPGWTWVHDYVTSDERFANLAKAYAASISGINYKFGVELPNGIAHALKLDKANGDDKWEKAINAEYGQIRDYKTFRRMKKGESMPPGYQRIPYHCVFDVKFDGRRKCRLVAGGNRATPTKEDVYSGVVSIDTVRLGFLLADMNGLQTCAADIGNAFLYGSNREKVYIVAGPEFGDIAGEKLYIDKSLYGLRSASARFHEHLAAKLRKMNFAPSLADNDFWMRKHPDGHYEYIAVYVDDLICYSKEPMKIIAEVKKDYILKGIGTPEYYLGGDVEDLDGNWANDGVKSALSARTYIENSVTKFEKIFGELRQYKSPMNNNYHPELDDSPFLDPLRASQYRSLIGSANWCITLGRFDIHFATSTFSRYNLAPREGHLDAMKRVFGYLKQYQKGRIIIDPSYRDTSEFPTTDYDNWKEFYSDAQEEMPHRMPDPYGRKARITCYVDADHAHDQLTRRSVTGILLFINNTPMRWFSKRQKTVETSTYGSELVAARIATDLVVEMRYVLRMLGIPVDGPALLLGDNASVVLNTTVPSSVLKKKHNACAYHRVREAIAGGILRFAHVPTGKNHADVLTKAVDTVTFHNLVDPVLF